MSRIPEYHLPEDLINWQAIETDILYFCKGMCETRMFQFLKSDHIRIFSGPIAGKYGSEIQRMRTLFTLFAI